MTQDYGPCGKCGKPMMIFNGLMPPVTWLGRPVCGPCAFILSEVVRKATTSLEPPVKSYGGA